MRARLVKRTEPQSQLPGMFVDLYATELVTHAAFTTADRAREQDVLLHYRLTPDRDAARLELAKLHDERSNVLYQAVGTVSPATRDLLVRVTDPETSLNTHAAMVNHDLWTLAASTRWNETHDASGPSVTGRRAATEPDFGVAADQALHLPLTDLTQRFFARHSTSDRGRLEYAHALSSLIAQGYPVDQVAKALEITPDLVAVRLAEATQRLEEALANQELFANVALAAEPGA